MDLITAFMFGFFLALSFGPIVLIVINNGISHGFLAALRSAIGATLGDFTFALVAFTIGVYLLTSLDNYKSLIHLFASLVLMVFGLWMLYGATQRILKSKKLNIHSVAKPVTLRTTYLLTIVNPLSIVAFTAFAGQIMDGEGILYAFILATMLAIGSLSMQSVYAVLASTLQSFFKKPLYVNILNVISGVAITIFGVLGIIHLG